MTRKQKKGRLIQKKTLMRMMKMTTWMTYQLNKLRSSTQEVLEAQYPLKHSDLGISEQHSNQRQLKKALKPRHKSERSFKCHSCLVP